MPSSKPPAPTTSAEPSPVDEGDATTDDVPPLGPTPHGPTPRGATWKVTPEEGEPGEVEPGAGSPDVWAEPPPDDLEPLLSAGRLAERVEGLAEEIAARMPRPFTALILLKGAFVFGADLVRALSGRGRHPRVEFLQLASYGDATRSSGCVRVVGEAPDGIAGRAVLVIDDVLDSGATLVEARRLLAEWGATEVRCCVLLAKPAARRAGVKADFVGFAIEDRFVVGYGMDHAEHWRHLPCLAVVSAE